MYPMIAVTMSVSIQMYPLMADMWIIYPMTAAWLVVNISNDPMIALKRSISIQMYPWMADTTVDYLSNDSCYDEHFNPSVSTDG
jgi:hypothetical protein